MAGTDHSGAPPSGSGTQKAPTGIRGLDEITLGGLPRRRITLLAGGAGSGKTVLGLETLVKGWRMYGEPGIFVAFEENPAYVIANAASFSWAPQELGTDELFLFDARLSPDVVRAGNFDLAGLLAGLSAKIDKMEAKRVVLDSVDALLLLLDPAAELREAYRLRDWLVDEDVTCILTAKTDTGDSSLQRLHGRLQFVSDCVIDLTHRMSEQVSFRSLRVVKYRGSSFSENACPMVIGPDGIELADMRAELLEWIAPQERVSSGVERLDAMLGGGYYRGSSTLITGSPGTAKSTLSGAFAEAACERGERTLYISFGEVGSEVIRNMSSVGIDLQGHVDAGTLVIRAARTESMSAEAHLFAIKALVSRYQPRCLIIDPISAMVKAGGDAAAVAVAQRLPILAKSEGITLVATSLIDSTNPYNEATQLQISTVADTWIHVSYLVKAGERNRALTIIKSRGTKHSNQVRELLLSDDGVTLADAYTSKGEVLMGTLRWEKEMEVQRSKQEARGALEIRRKKQELAEVELRARLDVLTRELDLGRASLTALREEQERMEGDWSDDRENLQCLRQADEEKDEGESG